MSKVAVGIDLGGTFIKFALLDEGLSLVASAQSPTPVDSGADGVIQAMAAGVKQLLTRQGVSPDEVVGVGVGSPGPLDLAAGVVVGMPNILGFENIPIRDRLAELLAVPAVLENDANAAALGEFLVGRGRGSRIMVLLTLGTGVGSGIVVDGKLLHGSHGLGGEMGHTIVDPGGERCGCGQQGCLERYVSAAYLAQYARRLVERDGRDSSLADVLAAKGDLDAKDVTDARSAGDALAEEVWDRAMHFLAVGCINICRIFDPDLIVLGGGLANAGEDLLGPLAEQVRKLNWKLSEPRTALALAELGNDAGVIGGAGAAWEQFGTN